MFSHNVNNKKRLFTEACAIFGALILAVNAGAASLGASSIDIKEANTEEKIGVSAQVQQEDLDNGNTLVSFKYKDVIAQIDKIIADQNSENLLYGDAAQAILLCEKFNTADDFNNLHLPKVLVLSGASLYTDINMEKEILTFDEADSVTLLYRSKDSNFYYVEYNDTYRGYVKSDSIDLSLLNADQIEQANQINRTRFGAVISAGKNLYASPSSGAASIETLAEDCVLEITSISGDYYQVKTCESLTCSSDYTFAYVLISDDSVERFLNAEVDSDGYIKAARAELERLAEEKAKEEAEKQKAEEEARKKAEEEAAAAAARSSYSSDFGEALASTALNYLGVPYVYGGASPSGFDCSGLVYYCAALNGLSVPHGATSLYYSAASYVSYGDWQVGDLIFFSSDWSSEIEHVGIYIGGGQFVHAPASGDVVKISSIYSDYFSRNYYSAARLN
jgi:cell wall-associated NlpC family hydrolase